MKLLPIAGELVILYPLQHEHIEQYCAYYSSLVQALLHVRSIKEELIYLQNQLYNQVPYFYVIFERKMMKIIGAIEIRSPVHRSQLYCWLNEKYWGKGYFQEAMRLLAIFYFKTSNQRMITARVDVKNQRSVHALKKVGFYEGKIVPGSHGMQYELVLEQKSLK